MSKGKKTKSYRDNLTTRSDEAKTVRKVVAIIILSLILIFTVGGISAYTYIKTALEPVDVTSKEEIKVTIPMGSSTSTIGKILEGEGIIKDARVFRFYIKFKNQSNFQAGEYTFTPSFTLDEIIESLKSGRIIADSVHTVTIPEGKTIQQMAEIYANKLSFSKEEFLEKVNDQAYINKLIQKYPAILSDDILDPGIRTPLEGYLFASTYSFYEESPSVEKVVEIMLDETASVIRRYRDQINEKDLTVHQAITFASLLENEEKTEEERQKIAGVFYNRLDKGMMLQTDPTVAYAIGKHLSEVLLKDLEVDSPYNTYKVTELPIGPISNFHENALKATVEPVETDYLFFLHDKEGNIHYSHTHDEHLIKKREYIDNQ